MNPEIDSLRTRAQELAQRGNFESEAEQLNRDILARSPRDLGAMNRLARCLEIRGAKAEAAEWSRTVLSIEPANSIAHDRLGRVGAEPAPVVHHGPRHETPGVAPSSPSWKPNPASESDAGAVIRALYPIEAELRTCLARLAASIRLLNHLPPDHWMITLERRLVRFNVSKLNCIAFEPPPRPAGWTASLLILLAEKSKVPTDIWELSLSLGGGRGPRPRSASHLDWVHLPSNHLDELLPRCEHAHRAAVLEATRGGRSPYLRAHSRGVVAFMHTVLGERIIGY